MEQNTRYNWHDRFIIFAIMALISGYVGVLNIINYNSIIGCLCLPFALIEIYQAFTKSKIQKIELYVVLWLLYAAVSVLWTPYFKRGLHQLIILFFNVSFFLGIFNHARHANKPINAFLEGWRVLILLTLCVAFWEIFTNQHIPYYGEFNEGNTISTASGGQQERLFAAVTYRNLNTYVTLLCMALPFLMMGLFRLPHKFWSILAICGAIVVLIVNSSRGGIFALVVDLVLFIYFYLKQPIKYKKTITLFFVGGIVILLSLFGTMLFDQLFGRLETFEEDGLLSDMGRWDVMRYGIEFCIDSFGLGCGIGSMVPMYESTGFWLHFAHNLVIEFLIEAGFWLLLPLIFLFVSNYRCLIKSKKLESKMLGWMLLLSFVPTIIIDDSYVYRHFMWMWILTQFIIGKYCVIDYEQHNPLPNTSKQ